MGSCTGPYGTGILGLKGINNPIKIMIHIRYRDTAGSFAANILFNNSNSNITTDMASDVVSNAVKNTPTPAHALSAS